ncbi:hypothetical protein ABTY61_32305 [Kitasatospora sp. NPDC096128]|uniref:hypothetical protein n=1 Tax=Kitasatospora sp. NPDC096128 TaxID=3155547 RepID=UPI0033267717
MRIALPVSTRTDPGAGPLTTSDLRPAVTTTELPGSSCTLGPLPRASGDHAPGHHHPHAPRPLHRHRPHSQRPHPPGLVLPRPLDGAPPQPSRLMTDREHLALYEALAAAGVIGLLPPSR